MYTYLNTEHSMSTKVRAVRPKERTLLLPAVLLFASLLTGCAHHPHQVLSPIHPAVQNNVPSIWPVPKSSARITSRFGEVRSGGRIHKGLDLATPRGTPVVAAAAGVASFTGTQRGYGNIVTVDHCNGLETAYAHLDEITTFCGARLEQGSAVGRVGATGNATGPHLHYEVRRAGEAVDPERYLP